MSVEGRRRGHDVGDTKANNGRRGQMQHKTVHTPQEYTQEKGNKKQVLPHQKQELAHMRSNGANGA